MVCGIIIIFIEIYYIACIPMNIIEILATVYIQTLFKHYLNFSIILRKSHVCNHKYLTRVPQCLNFNTTLKGANGKYENT